MIETIKEPQERINRYSLAVCALIFFSLLMMRDVGSVTVNKYIFLIITCICAVCMKVSNLIYLFCFLFPLYVGLPGNYMTLVLIARLLLEVRQFKKSSLMSSIAIAVFVLVQNLLTGYTGIVPMMFIVGVFIILMLFTYNGKLDRLPMIIMYSAGVAALGIIMLSSTLNVYELSDLMSSSFRLGTDNVSLVEEGVMKVSVDPNFYGMFSIASISIAFPIVFQSKVMPVVKWCLSAFMVAQLVICLIGLSRAFVSVFIMWILLYLMFQRNFKGTIIALIVIFTIIVLVVNFMPEVIKTILARFADSDIATGNGRTDLILKFWNEWSSSIVTMIFGIGLYNCNVHCMPLQFFFGGGLLLFSLVIALFISYRSVPKVIKRTLDEYLPFIVTFTMMCTVPAVGLLNCMFPLALTALTMQRGKGQSEMGDKK